MKICIVIPYFGNFPPYISTFLYSASYNNKINWLIFTDQSTGNLLHVDNVKFVKTTFENIRSRLESVAGKHIVLDAPYKLCDYKPLYGKAFSDYLNDYDYWGYGDLDVVTGDIMKFIYPGLELGYDRIGDLGHFSLFKNTSEVNNRYKLSVKDKNGKVVKLFDKVRSHSRGYAFDELGMRRIYHYYGFSTYKNADLVNETKTGCLDLYSIDSRFRSYDGVFIWNKGKCLYYYLVPGSRKLYFHEFGYFHFLKRHEFTHFLDYGVRYFGVTTNGYFSLTDVNEESVKRMISINHSSMSKRLKYTLHSYFFSGDITFRKVLGIHLPVFEIYREIKNHTLRL